MYSVQHVLWRGAMALSLLVVGGVGAGVSVPQDEQAANECRENADPQVASSAKQPFRHVVFDTIVVRAAPLESQADEA
jgi:hypothetical protein